MTTQGKQAQPKALRLADLLLLSGALPGSVSECAAAELRRLHSQVAALTAQPAAPQGVAYAEIIKGLLAVQSTIGPRRPGARDQPDQEHWDCIDAAIAALRASNGQAPAGVIGWVQDRLPEKYRDVPILLADGAQRVGRINRAGCWELASYQVCKHQYMASDVKAWFDTAPTPQAGSVLEDAARLGQIAEAIRDYHCALDMRKHGGDAARKAVFEIERILGMRWKQGEEAARRAARKQGGM